MKELSLFFIIHGQILILFSHFFTTLTFQAFLCLSIGGTLFHGYFFAFHLLNIVNNNQLLSGVIKAVTQNGEIEFDSTRGHFHKKLGSMLSDFNMVLVS